MINNILQKEPYICSVFQQLDHLCYASCPWMTHNQVETVQKAILTLSNCQCQIDVVFSFVKVEFLSVQWKISGEKYGLCVLGHAVGATII